MRICIDPGHGGIHPGTRSIDDTHKEEILVLKYAHRIRNLLIPEYEIIYTRLENKELHLDLTTDLIRRTTIAKENKCDLFVSLHCDGFHNPQAYGWSIWTTKGETKSDTFAENIFNSVHNHLPSLRQRRDIDTGEEDRESNFLVLRYCEKYKIPAVLIELGFMTNPNDMTDLISHTHQSIMCKAIVEGIDKTFKEKL